MSQSDVCNSQQAAEVFKETVNDLMSGLNHIVRRGDPNGGAMPSLQTLISAAGSSGSGGLTKIFDEGLTPTQKFIFAQSWAKAMDSKIVMEQFIASTKPHWKNIEKGNQQEQEQALLAIIDGLNIPGSSASFLRSVYEKKNFLTEKEKGAVLQYFKDCCYYGEIYEQFKKKERGKGAK